MAFIYIFNKTSQSNHKCAKTVVHCSLNKANMIYSRLYNSLKGPSYLYQLTKCILGYKSKRNTTQLQIRGLWKQFLSLKGARRVVECFRSWTSDHKLTHHRQIMIHSWRIWQFEFSRTFEYILTYLLIISDRIHVMEYLKIYIFALQLKNFRKPTWSNMFNDMLLNVLHCRYNLYV